MLNSFPYVRVGMVILTIRVNVQLAGLRLAKAGRAVPPIMPL